MPLPALRNLKTTRRGVAQLVLYPTGSPIRPAADEDPAGHPARLILTCWHFRSPFPLLANPESLVTYQELATNAWQPHRATLDSRQGNPQLKGADVLCRLSARLAASDLEVA
jgi:hypothetical protein